MKSQKHGAEEITIQTFYHNYTWWCVKTDPRVDPLFPP